MSKITASVTTPKQEVAPAAAPAPPPPGAQFSYTVTANPTPTPGQIVEDVELAGSVVNDAETLIIDLVEIDQALKTQGGSLFAILSHVAQSALGITLKKSD